MKIDWFKALQKATFLSTEKNLYRKKKFFDHSFPIFYFFELCNLFWTLVFMQILLIPISTCFKNENFTYSSEFFTYFTFKPSLRELTMFLIFVKMHFKIMPWNPKQNTILLLWNDIIKSSQNFTPLIHNIWHNSFFFSKMRYPRPNLFYLFIYFILLFVFNFLA